MEHVPELRRMAFDMSLNMKAPPACYGPVHAARALGTLHPPKIIGDLIELTRRLDRNDEDFWLEDMPRFLDDTGTPDIGIAGNGYAEVVDMGCYEFAGTSCRVDFDGDGAVNSQDFIAFLNAYVIGC